MMRHHVKKGNNWDILVEESASATFSCRHRVTKRPICATPCNGIIELCENDADEQCQGTGLSIVLSLTFVFSVLFVAAAFLISKFISSKEKKLAEEQLEINQLGQKNENDILKLKSPLCICMCNFDYKNSTKLADEYYKEGSKRDNVDKHIMHSFGTNELTAFFYDCIDRSITIRFGSLVQHTLPKLLNILKEWKFQEISAVIQCIINLSIRYSDLPKDILFLYLVWIQLGNYSTGSFPMVIFWILLSSIIASEIVHSITIMIYQSTFVRRRAMILLMTPLMPAFIMYEQLQLKLNLYRLCQERNKTQKLQNEKLDEYEAKCNELQLVTAKMKSTENVLENLPLLTILIMTLSLSQSKTRAVENIDNIFVNDNESLGYFLAAWSFISMIRGQASYLKANKNGCLGLKGTVLVFPYFVLGTCSRYDVLGAVS